MILVTGGCSFSDCSWPSGTWPQQLTKILKCDHYPTGLGSQGNGLISRKVLYQVDSLLNQNIKANDILVGIMWSGPNRGDFYSEERPSLMENGELENPTSFVQNDEGGWVIMNQHWNDRFSMNYYKNMYNNTWGQIQTLEHMLRLQWYFKSKRIKFFQMVYTDSVFDKSLLSNPNISYLYNQIDLSSFACLQGEYEWVSKHAIHIPFSIDGFHPSPEQHLYFTKKVIVPFLKKKKFISC